MPVNFDHSLLSPSLRGPRAALPVMFSEWVPASLLDVGCGLGVWTKAALKFGIEDVLGLDGEDIVRRGGVISSTNFRHQLVHEPFSLGRSFEVALCLEVGEHLAKEHARILIGNLVDHADVVYFSAACPGQPGQHHVNCQWPQYWQELFNERGYVCDDSIRWKLWNVAPLGFCYRQNLIVARRDPRQAGKEARIRPVVHPELVDLWEADAAADRRLLWLKQVEQGSQTIGWYLSLPIRALGRKLNRRIFVR